MNKSQFQETLSRRPEESFQTGIKVQN